MRRSLTTMSLDWLATVENRLAMMRARLKWARWQRLGMHIGRDVVLPLSTSVDSSYCYLITIGDRCHFGPQCLIDRKSTRLNSSHVRISYAVFCLKKKNRVMRNIADWLAG